MFASYLKIALGNLKNHKLYAAINVLGLAVGLACCLLISIFVRHELGYDRDFQNAERIYRLSPDFAASADVAERHVAGNVAPVAPLIRAGGVEGVSEVARIGGMQAMIARENLAFYEDNFYWADPEIFRIFHLDWLRGNADAALQRPDGVVISARMARKYFGNEDPLGQTLQLESTWQLTVTGVIADLPPDSHLAIDLIVPMDMAWKLLEFDYGNNWAYTNFHTYLLLEPGAAIEAVVADVEGLVDAALAGGIGQRFGIAPGGLGFTAHPLADIHLYSNRPGEFRPPGNLDFVLTFSVIAAGLLFIACINFMNLATARASRRAREVGMRKVVGAQRHALIGQFLGESSLVTLAALALALVLVELLLPVFSSAIGSELDMATLKAPGFIAFIAGIAFLTALVAGSYPAFYLSGLEPVRVLRLQGGGASGKPHLRNLLVIVQFTLAIALLAATSVVWLQMRYVRNFDLGFDKEQVLLLAGSQQNGLGPNWNVLKQTLREYPGITHVTEGGMQPGSETTWRVRLEGGSPQGVAVLTKRIGFDFFATYGIPLIAGRDFDASLASDVFVPPANAPEAGARRGAYVLSEAAVRALGFAPEDVLGHRLDLDFSSDFSFTVPGPVIGVVADVYLDSLHSPLQPLVYFVPGPLWGESPSMHVASLRIEGAQLAAAVDWIGERWREFTPGMPVLHHFLDADFDALYQTEERQGRLFTFFAVLTIVIACLGIFGLASFTVERRFREIGVRKVMGGSAWSIVWLLTNDFSRLVLIANVIAWPLAYVAMRHWLDNFAYRIDLTPMIFLGSGLIALCVAWVTVGGTAAKAANAKPVLALRYE